MINTVKPPPQPPWPPLHVHSCSPSGPSLVPRAPGAAAPASQRTPGVLPPVHLSSAVFLVFRSFPYQSLNHFSDLCLSPALLKDFLSPPSRN